MAGQATSWLNTVTLPEFSDLVTKDFIFQNETPKLAAAQLYNQLDLTSNNSQQKRFDEVDVGTFAKLKREGTNASKTRSGVGYNKTMTARRMAREIDISWEMRRYGETYKVKNRLKELSGFVNNRRDLDLTHRFTFASATTYVDMDGVTRDISCGDSLQLAYSAHTLAHSSTTYRNRIAADPIVSQGAIEAGQSLFVSDIYNNFGEVRTVTPSHIVTSNDPNTVNTVRKIMQSSGDIDAAHAGVLNVNKNLFTHVILPNLATTATGARDATKRRFWFLIAVGEWQAYYGIFEGTNMKDPASGNNGEDMHNDNWTYGTRGSASDVVVSAKGLVASLPTS